MKYWVETYGCQMNLSDSERIVSLLKNLGFSPAKERGKADLLIFNTCSVRQKAEDRVLGQMKNLKVLRKKNPRLLAGITGCMVRKSGTRNSLVKDQLLRRLPAVDFVFRIEDLPKLPRFLKELGLNFSPRLGENGREEEEGNLESYFKIHPFYTSKFQAYLPIMTGCDNFCSYCVVPYARGREKSRGVEEILKEAEKLVENGCREITLLGQNVNSYGLSAEDRKRDLFQKLQSKTADPPFVFLLKELNKLKGLKRLRFISAHPKDMSDELIEAMASLKVLCPYLHLPVQSGDNEVLKKMNRNYTREHYLKLIAKIRAKIPDCAISTDIIVGFPGETEEQFENTCRLFQEVKWDMAYLARYSPRPETPSAQKFKDDVSPEEKARRFQKLNQLLKKISLKKNQTQVGRIFEVLVEKQIKAPRGIFYSGRTPHFKEVLFPVPQDHPLPNKFSAPSSHPQSQNHPVLKKRPARLPFPPSLLGQILPVKILKAKEWILEGELIS